METEPRSRIIFWTSCCTASLARKFQKEIEEETMSSIHLQELSYANDVSPSRMLYVCSALCSMDDAVRQT